jgi:hypothetical protein
MCVQTDAPERTPVDSINGQLLVANACSSCISRTLACDAPASPPGLLLLPEVSTASASSGSGSIRSLLGPKTCCVKRRSSRSCRACSQPIGHNHAQKSTSHTQALVDILHLLGSIPFICLQDWCIPSKTLVLAAAVSRIPPSPVARRLYAGILNMTRCFVLD